MTTTKIDYYQWLTDLKVGSDVAYGNNRYGGRPQYRFSKIKSISPTVRVITLESGGRFDAYGDELAKTLFPEHLLPPEEARERIAEHQAKVEKRQKMRKLMESARSRIEELNLEQLESLNAFLEGL